MEHLVEGRMDWIFVSLLQDNIFDKLNNVHIAATAFYHISRPLLLCLANGIAMPCETACMLELCCKASSTAVLFRARMVGALRTKRSRSGVNSCYPATQVMWINVHDFPYRQSTIHHGISNISETSLSSLFARKNVPWGLLHVRAKKVNQAKYSQL